MIEMKTTELIGPALDWAVAMAEGAKPERPHDGQVSFGSAHLLCGSDQERGFHAPFYSPSTNWNQGGPLIEQHGIEVFCNLSAEQASRFKDASPDWRACMNRGRSEYSYGPTPLIAAMRCLCAAKLGEVVTVPQELLS